MITADRHPTSPPPSLASPEAAAEIISRLTAAIRAQIATADSVLLSGTAEALRLLAEECDLAVDRRAETFARAVQGATEGPPPLAGGTERFVPIEDLTSELGLPAPRVQRHFETDVILARPDGLFPVALNRRRIEFVEIQPIDAIFRVLDEAEALLGLVTRLRLHMSTGTDEERLARLALYVDTLGCFESVARLHAAMHRGPEGALANALVSSTTAAHMDTAIEDEIATLRDALGTERVDAALMDAHGTDLALLIDHDPLVAPGLARVLRDRAEGLVGPKRN